MRASERVGILANFKPASKIGYVVIRKKKILIRFQLENRSKVQFVLLQYSPPLVESIVLFLQATPQRVEFKH